MMDFGRWNRLLLIEEMVYHDVTLEVLNTIKVDRGLIEFAKLKAILVLALYKALALELHEVFSIAGSLQHQFQIKQVV